MYADENARGGVLEPEGIVGIKYRREKQLDTMARLDPEYGSLRAKLAEKDLTHEQQTELKAKMTQREKLLGPVYLQIALQFADLHDRAGRMEAKGTIRMPLQWKNARRFFYWRLRRRLSEEVLLRKIVAASPTPPTNAFTASSLREINMGMLKQWSGLLDREFDRDDRKVAEWYEGHRKESNSRIESLRTEMISKKVADMMMANKDGGLKGVREVLAMVPTGEREQLVKYLLSG